MGWLRAAGYTTLGCVGPARTFGCPGAAGYRCPLREAADLTVVDGGTDPAGLCAVLGHTPQLTIGHGDPSSVNRRAFLGHVSAATGPGRWIGQRLR